MAEKRKSGSGRKALSCPVTAYARGAVSGKIVAGRLVRLACERHLADLKLGAKRGLVWDGDAARHAIDFFGHLRHSTGEWAGEPFMLQPWQQFVVGSLYGWKRKPRIGQDSLRRFRCHSACNIDPLMEWAPGAGQVQTADLTMGRIYCSSNCAGLM